MIIDGHDRGGIFPFAQTEMVSTFMEGISPAIKATIYNFIHRISEELPNAIVDDAADDGISPEQRNNIQEGLKGILRSAEEQLREGLARKIRGVFRFLYRHKSPRVVQVQC